MNLNRFEGAHACGRITLAPSYFHRIAQQCPHSFKQDNSGAGFVRKLPKHGVDMFALHLINPAMAVLDQEAINRAPIIDLTCCRQREELR